MSNQKKTIINLIESLADVISEDKILTNEYLKSTGIDPNEIEVSGKSFIRKAKGRLRLKLAEKKYNRFREIKGLFVFQKDKLVEKSKEIIAEALSNGNKTAFQTYYRKLDELTERDFKEINNEQEFLSFIEKFDK